MMRMANPKTQFFDTSHPKQFHQSLQYLLSPQSQGMHPTRILYLHHQSPTPQTNRPTVLGRFFSNQTIPNLYDLFLRKSLCVFKVG